MKKIITICALICFLLLFGPLCSNATVIVDMSMDVDWGSLVVFNGDGDLIWAEGEGELIWTGIESNRSYAELFDYTNNPQAIAQSFYYGPPPTDPNGNITSSVSIPNADAKVFNNYSGDKGGSFEAEANGTKLTSIGKIQSAIEYKIEESAYYFSVNAETRIEIESDNENDKVEINSGFMFADETWLLDSLVLYGGTKQILDWTDTIYGAMYWGSDVIDTDTEKFGIFNTGISAEIYIDSPIHTPVPEPTTMLLFGTGLIGLAGARRKFRKQ